MADIGSYYVLNTPEFPKIIGQGEMPSSLSITTKDGRQHNLPFGQVYIASDEVDVVENDNSQYPYISDRLIDSMGEQFTLLSTGD